MKGSDDAIVVLVSKNPDQTESECEYRTSYIPNLEQFYGVFDPQTGKWTGDSGIILDLFAEKTIFTELEAALEEACTISSQNGEDPQNGICVIRDFSLEYFNEL